MTKFDLAFDPPAPVAKVAMRTIENGKRLRDIKLLIDTGSDVTLLPKANLIELGVAPSEKTYDLIGFEGNAIRSNIYHLQVIFLEKRFIGNYCAVDDAVGILGRDILNKFTILFDGPSIEWSEIRPS